jgi:integrase/recombinase XerD
VLYQTGLRISEALGLTWGDVEFGERPCVRVRTQVCRGKRRGLKSKSSRRTVPLSAGTARELWKLRGGQAQPDAPVFATRRGTPLSASNMRNRVLVPAREATGLEWVTFHSFRHTAASMLFEQGRDIQGVQHWLGHESAAFTQKVYVHLRDRDLGSADFFDAPLTPDPVATGGNPVATDAPQQPATRRALKAVREAS